MSKKHILIISQYFYPESFRINDIATEWVKRGYKVTVLTGIPNYPTGKFYEGYSWTKRRKEQWNGIDIIRIPLIARGQSSIGMILNYYSFVISGWIWNRVNKLNADIVFSFEVSPMTQVKVGCGYSRKHRIPHFLYVQDLWPENVEAITGISNRLIIGPLDRMVDKIYQQVDEIFVTSPSFVDAIVNRRKPVDNNKVHYWPQYYESFYKPSEKSEVDVIPDDGRFKIIFTGNIGTAQGLDILPQVALRLRDENVVFILVGEGRYLSSFKKIISTNNVQDMFIFIPRVPADYIPKFLSACDVCFVSFAQESIWEKTIPAKLQTYMACGKPIVASASGETKRLIEEANCGVCAKIGDVEELVSAINYLRGSRLSELGNNGYLYAKEHFDKDKLLDQMDMFLR